MTFLERRVSLPPDPRSAGNARRFARDVLLDWGLGPLIEPVELALSELVTNSVLHARTAVGVCVSRRDGRVRVEVTDRSTVVPRQREHPLDAATGRGLQILDVLADAWGVVQDPAGGKLVWFELAVDGGRSAGRRAGHSSG